MREAMAIKRERLRALRAKRAAFVALNAAGRGAHKTAQSTSADRGRSDRSARAIERHCASDKKSQRRRLKRGSGH